jgi:hypothetical protein
MLDIVDVLPYAIPPYHTYSTIAFDVSLLRQCKLYTNPQIYHNYQLRFRSAFPCLLFHHRLYFSYFHAFLLTQLGLSATN